MKQQKREFGLNLTWRGDDDLKKYFYNGSIMQIRRTRFFENLGCTTIRDIQQAAHAWRQQASIVLFLHARCLADESDVEGILLKSLPAHSVLVLWSEDIIPTLEADNYKERFCMTRQDLYVFVHKDRFEFIFKPVKGFLAELQWQWKSTGSFDRWIPLAAMARWPSIQDDREVGRVVCILEEFMEAASTLDIYQNLFKVEQLLQSALTVARWCKGADVSGQITVRSKQVQTVIDGSRVSMEQQTSLIEEQGSALAAQLQPLLLSNHGNLGELGLVELIRKAIEIPQ